MSLSSVCVKIRVPIENPIELVEVSFHKVAPLYGANSIVPFHNIYLPIIGFQFAKFSLVKSYDNDICTEKSKALQNSNFFVLDFIYIQLGTTYFIFV